MDDLEKVDIGDGVIPQPTYVSVRLNTSQKQEIIELLKAYMCYFACLGLHRDARVEQGACRTSATD
jgi:hypothetical protein